MDEFIDSIAFLIDGRVKRKKKPRRTRRVTEVYNTYSLAVFFVFAVVKKWSLKIQPPFVTEKTFHILEIWNVSFTLSLFHANPEVSGAK